MANQMSTNDQGAKQRAAEIADTAKSETRGVVDDARQVVLEAPGLLDGLGPEHGDRSDHDQDTDEHEDRHGPRSYGALACAACRPVAPRVAPNAPSSTATWTC